MIPLESEDLLLLIDPERGADILSVQHRCSRTELLFQAPWKAAPPTAGEPDADAWTHSWRGGWQLLFPNAGAVCTVGGRDHGFHGAASLARWDVISTCEQAVELAWRDKSGLAIRRHVELDRRTVRASTRVRNDSGETAPFVLVEHMILGPPLVGVGTTITAPESTLLPLADEGPPLVTREDALPWPWSANADTREDWSCLPAGRYGRFGSLLGMDNPSVTVTSPTLGIGVRLRWSKTLPFAWLWEEMRSLEEPPFHGAVACLGIEPASTPTADGLAANLHRNDATVLAPDDELEVVVELEALQAQPA